MKHRMAAAVLSCGAALAVPTGARAETINVACWTVARGGSGLNPAYNPYLRDAIRDGLGYPGNDVVFVQIGDLTELPSTGAEFAFFWVMKRDQTLITPLSPEEQTALGDWVHAGGSAFLVFDHADYGESNLGSAFGVHTEAGLWGTWPVTLDPATPITNGPFGVIETTVMAGVGWFDTDALLPGFVPSGWLDTNAEVVQGYYDFGILSEGSGVIASQGDTTKLWSPSWREEAGAMVSNFYAYALAGPSCVGDLDGSGALDFGDLLAILAAWGPCEGECPEDLDGSGAVDFGDLLLVLGEWGPCP